MNDKDKIRGLAVRFRGAILKCDRTELPLSLAEFPNGSCADASMLLGTYFVDNGMDGFVLIKGRRGQGSLLETHCWIEKDGIIVDITGDQFEEVNEEVIVTGIDNSWYGTFQKSLIQKADYRMIVANDVRAQLNAVYDYILAHDS